MLVVQSKNMSPESKLEKDVYRRKRGGGILLF